MLRYYLIVDMEWSFDRFLLIMKAEGKEYSYEGGHAVFSQKLGGEQMDLVLCL